MPNRIKIIRKKRGISQQKLADIVGTGRSQIVKLERGERRLTTDWMTRIGRALKCHPADLLPSENTVRAPDSFDVNTQPTTDDVSAIDEDVMRQAIEDVLVYVVEENNSRFDPAETAEGIMQLYRQRVESEIAVRARPRISLSGNVVEFEGWQDSSRRNGSGAHTFRK